MNITWNFKGVGKAIGIFGLLFVGFALAVKLGKAGAEILVPGSSAYINKVPGLNLL